MGRESDHSRERAVGHCTDQPPSEATTWPVTLVASSLSSQVMDAASCAASATGGIVESRPPTRSCPSSEAKLASMLVATGPGATAFTRMFLPAYMKALDRVSPTTACLEVV